MKQSVLFLCAGNSARSQIAEALLRHQSGDQFDAYSAGTSPQPIDSRTLKAIEAFGVDTKGLHSKSVEAFKDKKFDYVITLCDKARNECEAYPNHQKLIAWNFPDPKDSEGDLKFLTTVRELSERIKIFSLVNIKELPLKSLTPLQFIKALADETRLRIVRLIMAKKRLCVCELSAATQISQPKISRHLAILKKSAVLQDQRQGQWIYYQINDQLEDWSQQILTALASTSDLQSKEDLLRLKDDKMQQLCS